MSMKRFSPLNLNRRRAVILIMSLWISMILAIMAYSTAYELRLNLRLARQGQSVMKARALARAGLAKGVMDLRNDKVLAIGDPAKLNSDSYRDVWALTDDKTEIELGGGTFTVRIEDEESKLNLNILNQQNAPVLGHILYKVGGFDPVEAQTLAFLIIDFQDPDLLPAAGQGDDEAAFYTEWGRSEFGSTLPADWKFKPKNDLIMSLDELLNLPGITRELLYGDPYDYDPREPRTINKIEEESDILADYITVQTGRSINMNTVSIITLEGLFRTALGSTLIAEDLAQKVYDYRLSLARQSDNRGTLQSYTQLQEAGVPLNELSKINAMITLAGVSNFYTITARGEYKGVVKTMQARVSVKVESFQTDASIPDSYGRRDKRASGKLRRINQNIIDPAVRVTEIKEI